MISDKEIKKLELQSTQNPKNIGILNLLADSYLVKQDYDKALDTLKRIIALDNTNKAAWMNRGLAYQRIRFNLLAIECFLEVLKCDQTNAEANFSIAVCFDNIGATDKAIEYYLKAINLSPNRSNFYTSLLFALHRNSGHGFESFYNLSKIYDKTFLSKYQKCDQSQFKERMNPEKKVINLGFLSCDLYNHPVMTNFFGVLEALSSQKEFNLFFYHTGQSSDKVTEALKQLSSSFHLMHQKSINEITEKILEDKVDILFDISGYENKEYFGVLKAKPAPVQVTHIGYWGTLGMDEIDFIIADNQVVKDDETKYFTEQVFRMPQCYASGQISGLVTPIQDPPCLNNGYITFGSMNKFHKINYEVITTWANLLIRVPNSRLLFGVVSESDDDFLFKQFEALGVERTRIIIKRGLERAVFLNYYNEIDIALNPFPFSGGTTTLESMFMGVPVINLDGNTWAGRLGTTIINAVDHQEFNCKNTEEYIDKAAVLANNIEQLKFYRERLKNDIEKSCLNIEEYTNAFTKAIFDMWTIACKNYH